MSVRIEFWRGESAKTAVKDNCGIVIPQLHGICEIDYLGRKKEVFVNTSDHSLTLQVGAGTRRRIDLSPTDEGGYGVGSGVFARVKVTR